jgi:hypothetical protein
MGTGHRNEPMAGPGEGRTLEEEDEELQQGSGARRISPDPLGAGAGNTAKASEENRTIPAARA